MKVLWVSLVEFPSLCEMLAQTIMRLFEQKNLSQLSTDGRQTALARHNREINAIRLVEIYNEIMNLC